MTEQIKLAHGGGGMLMQELIRRDILPRFANQRLAELADSARLEVNETSLAFTTDSFVVQPLLFPGGDIGRLAVCGTVNDLAARGAGPLALSLALIIEEGLARDTLNTVLDSAAAAAREAEVEILTGDTKVIERRTAGASNLFINTSGLGLLRPGLDFRADRIEPGDVLIINGPIGDHGIAVMSVREGIQFVSGVESDVASLAKMTAEVLDQCGAAVKAMKDPTRGGLAANLNEMAVTAGFVLEESAVPVRPAVQGACEMLGLDVLTVANEGKMIFAVHPTAAGQVMEILRRHPLGRGAAIIGRADDRVGLVRLKTVFGSERIIETPYGEELPRIC